MDDETRNTILVGSLILGLMIFVLVFFGLVRFNPSWRAAWNSNESVLHEVDDATKYETKKSVEDTCRAMITSYESDKLIYEQYKDSKSSEQRSWAEQAKMRANKSAIFYNEYIMRNEYVWADNVPSDIRMKLEVIE